MRRALLALTVGLLLTTTACGTARNSGENGSSGSGATAAALSPEAAQTKELCEAIGQVYSTNMGPFAESLTKLAAERKAGDADAAQQKAQQTLETFATAVRDTTKGSAAAGAQDAGAKAADAMQKKAGDDKYFAGIESAADVDKVLTGDLKAWLDPISKRCS